MPTREAPPPVSTEPTAGAPWLTVLAAATTVLLWASAFVAIRHVGHRVPAGALSLGRLVAAGVVLGVVEALRRARTGERRPWPRRGLWPRLLVVGVLWFGVYNVALNEAERHLDAGTAAMLVNIGPILIALLAGLFLGEGLPRTLVAGGLIAFAGVVVIGLATSGGSGGDTWGSVLCVVAAVAYAIGVIGQKPLLTELSALQVTWLSCLIGAVTCLPFAGDLARIPVTADTVGWIVYLGVFPTAIAFTTWAYALARTSAGKQGMTTYLVPPLAVLLGWALLSESPPALAFAGGALCLAGVAVTRRRTRAART